MEEVDASCDKGMPAASTWTALLCVVTAVQGRNLSVLVFGDSWGALDPSWHALQDMFDRHGVNATVRSSAVGSTRACQWAAQPDSLRQKAAALFPDGGPDR